MLSPYAIKPRTNASAIYPILIEYSDSAKAITKAPKPEPNPFTMTICKGFFKDSILVQLFSNPQKTQPSNTNIEPKEKEMLPKSCTDKIILEIVMSTMAIHIRFPTASLK